MSGGRLAVALLHHPVLDRRGDLVTTAITNLDLHDIARVSCTYGVERFYVVTPSLEQQALAGTIIGHWRDGYGAQYNPDRRTALALAEVVTDLDAALADWQRICGTAVMPLLTAARRNDGIDFAAARDLLKRQPLLLVLGTGWGLAPQLFDHGWPVLEALRGVGDYNHLPVRAATAIMLDRLRNGAQ